MSEETALLDHGYVKLIETWGSDERIIEAARMSTSKGFLGWGGVDVCQACDSAGALNPGDGLYINYTWAHQRKDCKECGGTARKTGDEKLLRYLYEHKHHTPFEMAGLTIEVQAPIFVFREWHRHRTQSYNELSSRYTELPDLFYTPSVERLIAGKQSKKNKQGSSGNEPVACAKHATTGVITSCDKCYIPMSVGEAQRLRGDIMASYQHSRDGMNDCCAVTSRERSRGW